MRGYCVNIAPGRIKTDEQCEGWVETVPRLRGPALDVGWGDGGRTTAMSNVHKFMTLLASVPRVRNMELRAGLARGRFVVVVAAAACRLFTLSAARLEQQQQPPCGHMLKLIIII